jgi:hypothetical protein
MYFYNNICLDGRKEIMMKMKKLRNGKTIRKKAFSIL